MSDQLLVDEISRRMDDIYRRWANGDDVPPAMVFRAEGFIEAACLGGTVSAEKVFELMNAQYQLHFEGPLPAISGLAVRIYSNMRRAPVYPSTR